MMGKLICTRVQFPVSELPILIYECDIVWSQGNLLFEQLGNGVTARICALRVIESRDDELPFRLAQQLEIADESIRPATRILNQRLQLICETSNVLNEK